MALRSAEHLALLLLLLTALHTCTASVALHLEDAAMAPLVVAPAPVLSSIPRALALGFKGGRAGAFAGFVQVVCLMWLRTVSATHSSYTLSDDALQVVNYQYRHQVTMHEAFRTLYSNGGVLRFYEGISFALVQGPLSKFGSIAANELANSLVGHSSLLATLLGSVLSALWRIFLMPIDTCKTVLQVSGSRGFHNMLLRVRRGDLLVLYEGTWATMLSTIASHYPWFAVHNWLDAVLWSSSSYSSIVLRSALIGLLASIVSDAVSNVLKVIKTVKQSSSSETLVTDAETGMTNDKARRKRRSSITYEDAVRQVLSEGGWAALFGRGLLARLLSNGVQSVLFTVIWKLVTIPS